MFSRREFIGTSLGAGASLVLAPELLRAHSVQAGKLMQRAIPSSGEMLPVISYGARAADPAAIKQILETYLANGGRFVDVLHGGPAGEQAARTAAGELGIQDRFFWTTPQFAAVPGAPGGPPGPPRQAEPAAIRAALEEKLAAFKKIDLVMISAAADASQMAVLKELKQQGRIRYIGVHELLFPPNAPAPYPPTSKLEALMRSEPIDFIGTDYHLGDRRLEEMILPLAQERKIAVMAYFPFDRGRIFKRAGSTPLPDWAADFDATTWAQFFLKYVLSHPAITVVRTGTTKAPHMLENIGAGMGRLPDEATRKRMAALVDTFPPTPAPGPAGPPPGITLPVAVIERYVGEYQSAAGFTVTIRREGEKLFVKPGNNPEAPLLARSETRFQDPRGPFFEFQVDSQGKVTGAVLEQQGSQGTQKIALERK